LFVHRRHHYHLLLLVFFFLVRQVHVFSDLLSAFMVNHTQLVLHDKQQVLAAAMQRFTTLGISASEIPRKFWLGSTDNPYGGK
jgi:hypothetical protein